MNRLFEAFAVLTGVGLACFSIVLLGTYYIAAHHGFQVVILVNSYGEFWLDISAVLAGIVLGLAVAVWGLLRIRRITRTMYGDMP